MRQPLTPKALNQQDKHLPTLPSNRIPTVVTQTPEDGIYIHLYSHQVSPTCLSRDAFISSVPPSSFFPRLFYMLTFFAWTSSKWLQAQPKK